MSVKPINKDLMNITIPELLDNLRDLQIGFNELHERLLELEKWQIGHEQQTLKRFEQELCQLFEESDDLNEVLKKCVEVICNQK